MVKKGFFVTVLISAILCAAFAGGREAEKVLAIIGEQKITQQDLNAFLQRVPEPFRKAFRKKALYQLIETRVFYAQAMKEAMNNSPDFLAELAREKQRLLANYYVEKRLRPMVKISPSEAKSYYEKHKFEFRGKERVKVEEIRFLGKKDAEEAKARLKKGEAFEDVQKENGLASPSPTGNKGFWIEKGKIPKTIEAAVFSLKAGQISDIVPFKTGYVIFRLIDRKDPGVRPVEEVISSIIKRLETQKLTSFKMEQLEKAGVKILDKSFEKPSGWGNGAFPPGK